MDLSSDLAEWSHSEASTCSKALTCSKWAPDSQWCTQPLRVRGRHAAGQAGQVECCTAAPLVAFPNTSLSHNDWSLACYFCHLVISMACLGSQWLYMRSACPQPFFLRTNWTSLPLALSNPLFPKLLATWGVELDFSLPTSSRLKVMRKTVDHGEMSILPILPHLPWLRGISLENFVSCVSYCWWLFGHLWFELSLKKHMAPDSAMLQIWNFPMLKDLTDEIWFSVPLFIDRQNNKWCLVFQQRHSFYSVIQWRMCCCLCCRFLFYL